MNNPDELDTLDVPALKALATSLNCGFSPNARRSSLYGLIRSKREHDAETEKFLAGRVPLSDAQMWDFKERRGRRDE